MMLKRHQNAKASNHGKHCDHGENSMEDDTSNQIRNRLIPWVNCRTLKRIYKSCFSLCRSGCSVVKKLFLRPALHLGPPLQQAF